MGDIELGDSIRLVKKLEDESVHLILSDIPYGISFDDWDVLHSNTNSALLGENPVEKQANGVFKKRGKPLNGWSKADRNIPREYYEWCRSWAPDWYRVLKPGASCFVFAGRRLAHRCISAMEDSGFVFKDMLSWEKDAAAYRAQRVGCVFKGRGDTGNATAWEGWKVGNLRPLFEPVLWFMKPYPVGTALIDNIVAHGVGGFNEAALKKARLLNTGIEVCSNVLKVKTLDSDRGLHPTQKPVALMEALIGLATKEGHTVLDPFCGGGTTLVAADNLKRNYIGFEINPTYYETAARRLGIKPSPPSSGAEAGNTAGDATP